MNRTPLITSFPDSSSSSHVTTGIRIWITNKLVYVQAPSFSIKQCQLGTRASPRGRTRGAKQSTAVDSGQHNNTARLSFHSRAVRARPLCWPLLQLLGRRPACFVRYRPAPRLGIFHARPCVALLRADERGWAGWLGAGLARATSACLPRAWFLWCLVLVDRIREDRRDS